MIKITLEGEDAKKWIESQTESDREESLALALKTATEYIDMLEEQLKTFTKPVKESSLDNLEVSSRISRDMEIAKEIETKAGGTKWSDGEINVIHYAMGRPVEELNRSFSTLVEKLARSEGAVRAKLSELGIKVEGGKLYYRD